MHFIGSLMAYCRIKIRHKMAQWYPQSVKTLSYHPTSLLPLSYLNFQVAALVTFLIPNLNFHHLYNLRKHILTPQFFSVVVLLFRQTKVINSSIYILQFHLIWLPYYIVPGFMLLNLIRCWISHTQMSCFQCNHSSAGDHLVLLYFSYLS